MIYIEEHEEEYPFIFELNPIEADKFISHIQPTSISWVDYSRGRKFMDFSKEEELNNSFGDDWRYEFSKTVSDIAFKKASDALLFKFIVNQWLDTSD